MKNNIHLGEHSKALALAVFWARKDFVNAEYLLQIPGEVFALKEVLKACTILDAARNRRAKEKILKRLDAQGCKKKKKMTKLKTMIGALQTEVVSVSMPCIMKVCFLLLLIYENRSCMGHARHLHYCKSSRNILMINKL